MKHDLPFVYVLVPACHYNANKNNLFQFEQRFVIRVTNRVSEGCSFPT
jgi:hypothetical protein